MQKTGKISGTSEWAVANYNCILGCPHHCVYCYARHDSVRRKICPSNEAWGTTYHKPKAMYPKIKKYDGTVMFPTTHDLTPENLDIWMLALDRLLHAGNNVLVVSKPHYLCIKEITNSFQGAFKKQILFRFTIGSPDDKILKFWEPGAPDFNERFQCLKLAFTEGFKTSVSVEPMLGTPKEIVSMFHGLSPHVTDSIWIGKMNRIRTKDGRLYRIPADTDMEQVLRIENNQTDDNIRWIYNELKDEPKVRWKESIKTVIGLPLAEKAGLDI